MTYAAAGDVPEHLLRSTRGWPQDAWDGAVDALQAQGWLEQGDELRFTELGASQRRALEEGTDTLAAAPYAVLGEERCAELRALARPWSTTSPNSCPDSCCSPVGGAPEDGHNGVNGSALGRLAQSVRAAALQPAGRGFESLTPTK